MLETDEEEARLDIKDAVFSDMRIGTFNVVGVGHWVSEPVNARLCGRLCERVDSVL